jgi:hypothetical protein
LAFEDIGEAEAYEHAFGFVDGFIGRLLRGVEFYVPEADRYIWKILKCGDIAAVDGESTGELFVEFADGEVDEALLLGYEDAECDAGEQEYDEYG